MGPRRKTECTAYLQPQALRAKQTKAAPRFTLLDTSLPLGREPECIASRIVYLQPEREPECKPAGETQAQARVYRLPPAPSAAREATQRRTPRPFT